ncbi:hypothetical protein R1flu_018370 [Riccia fluitans]|uniref:LTI65/LTI78 N-terminal domain-containing protein n=1 Tax=Riccia fluitans TaxID=41844 RepID=A0ABD1ZGM8_9MARC
MPQIYGHTRESNELSPVTLTPADSEEEKSREMATMEPTSPMDTSAADSGEKKKPSLMKKVKAKAKKLKNKLKPGSGHRADELSPTHDQQHDDDGSSSSSSDEQEDDDQELGYTPLTSSVNTDDDKRTAHATTVPGSGFDNEDSRQMGSDVNLGAGYGMPHEDRKFGLLDEPSEKGPLAQEDPAAPKPPTSTVPISSSSPLSQFRSAGPAGAEQAVPTSYNYYNKDPTSAYKTPSPEALGITSGSSESAHRDETPSALGGESTGVTPILSESRAFGSGISVPEAEDRSQPGYSNRSAERSEEEDRDAKIPVGILAPGEAGTESKSNRHDDSLSGRNYNQDVGMATPTTSDVKGTLASAKDAALDKVGYGSTDEQTPTEQIQPADTSSAESPKRIHKRAYEGLTAAGVGLTGAVVGMGQKLGVYRDYDHGNTPAETTTDEPTISQKAYDTVVGAKDTVAQNIPGVGTPAGEPTVGQKAYDTAADTKDAAADKISGETSERTMTDKAYGAVVGAKDAAADKLGYNTNNTQQSSPTGEPTMAQKAYDTILGTKDAVASKLPLGATTTQQPTEPSVGEKAYDTTAGMKDAAADTVSSGAGEPTVTQKAYGTLLGVKDAAADEIGVGAAKTSDSVPSDDHPAHTSSFFDSKAAPVSEFNESSEQSKPVSEKVGETATGWKDSITKSLGMGSPSPATEGGALGVNDRGLAAQSETEGKPVTQKAAETGRGLMENVASKFGYQGSATKTPSEQAAGDVEGRAREADVAMSSDSTPVSQKAADTVYQAKDSAVSTFSPTKHDKELSQTVTESISNLPTLLTEKLGFGNKSAPATPSGTTISESKNDFKGPAELDVPVSANPENLSPAANTPESAASPGIVNRVSGVVSSFFGGNKKTSAGGGGEEYSPASSLSGDARRDITDTTPMVTDTSGVDTHRSSPAA